MRRSSRVPSGIGASALACSASVRTAAGNRGAIGRASAAATTAGALSGAVLALYLREWLMLLIFAFMLAYMAWAAFSTRNLDDKRIAEGSFASARQDRLSHFLDLRGDYHDQGIRQVPDAELALVHGTGGVLSSAGTAILGRV